MVKNMAMANLYGLMGVLMKVGSMIIILKDKVRI
jgi:hypothetical protein